MFKAMAAANGKHDDEHGEPGNTTSRMSRDHRRGAGRRRR
jgi:hypothetical protein